MRRIRFHIGGLLGLIILIAVALAALREANDLWASAVFTVTLAVLLISVLLSVHRAQASRAFWLGFALFGCTYLGLCLIPLIESRLITTKLLAYLDSRVPARPVIITGEAWGPIPGTQVGSTVQNPVQGYVVAASNPNTQQLTVFGNLLGNGGTSENFIRIGHGILTLLVALTGGVLSRRLYAGRPDLSPGRVPLAVSRQDDGAA
jgi:hypothetical protein